MITSFYIFYISHSSHTLLALTLYTFPHTTHIPHSHTVTNNLKKGGTIMEDTGMTDKQWKDNLRYQLGNWEDVRDLALELDSENNPVAQKLLKLINRNITRIQKGLSD